MVVRDGHCLTVQQQKELIREVTYEEIIDAIKTMPKEKAPRVDGFPIEFLTLNWELLKDEIVQVVQQFFNTAITLIPKVYPLQRSCLHEELSEVVQLEGMLNHRNKGYPMH
ncbi:hypothetical protein H5410_003943 [Solanum commersonii]|uniref:Uncharacterized protein n=1 Tax=Solanum commersonii TaxID=4109 RepID=A0A9J6B6J7_SOLCO|nr:hypothetical protein H5410_003943 [Solanum commersonii]